MLSVRPSNFECIIVDEGHRYSTEWTYSSAFITSGNEAALDGSEVGETSNINW